MGEMIDINMTDISEVICSQILRRYAVTNKLVREDFPNQWGVSVSFGNKEHNEGIARFVFVTKQNFLVEIMVNLREFVLQPEMARGKIHELVRGTIEAKLKHDQESSNIIITSPGIQSAAAGAVGSVLGEKPPEKFDIIH